MAHVLPFVNLLRLINSEPNYYATFGLDRQCTADQIRAAYRILAKQHHPDVNPAAPAASVRIRELNEAYETLSDPERRRAYDESLKTLLCFASSPTNALPTFFQGKDKRPKYHCLIL